MAAAVAGVVYPKPEPSSCRSYLEPKRARAADAQPPCRMHSPTPTLRLLLSHPVRFATLTLTTCSHIDTQTYTHVPSAASPPAVCVTDLPSTRRYYVSFRFSLLPNAPSPRSVSLPHWGLSSAALFITSSAAAPSPSLLVFLVSSTTDPFSHFHNTAPPPSHPPPFLCPHS